MWPQALQMTREECRGILRRLELESYSHVISVFRAQGGLSENKTKLLEELRTIFHISQERHRAEARRVANDEQLSTIAEAISGPNTWQEWSREGRRSFPMLPRIAPQTALALIANNVASEIANENSKCPYPADTAAAVVEEQTVYAATRDTSSACGEGDRSSSYIVTSDPFKMPDIPSGPKKNLKRNMPDNHTGSSKKRLINEISPTKQQQHQKQYQHITANSPNAALSLPTSNIRKLYHNHSKLQQQRYFHQQQMQKQKTSTKKSNQASPSTTTTATTTNKRQATPAKSGRRAQQKLLQEQQRQQQILQQQQADQAQQQIQSSLSRNAAYASNNSSNISDFKNCDLLDELKDQQHYIAMPQIAASKKDITKNLTKLQIPSAAITPTSTAARQHEQHVLTATSPTNATNITSMLHGKMEKQLISTPVQKIILEDRQPPASPSSSSPVQHVSLSSSPQIMTLPQITAAATKLRAINTTILPPGTKLTKKLPASTILTATSAGNTLVDHSPSSSNSITSQPQVFSIIDGTTINTAGTIIAQSPPAAPTHTPPAIIQLHSSSATSHSSEILQPTPPTQGKVLTTKLVPIVLSGTASGNVTTTSNITSTLNNNSIVAAGSGTTATNTMIKNLPSSMLLPNQINSSGGSGITTLGSGATVFRKTPNIIKTGFIGVGGTSGVVGGTAAAAKISSNFNTNASNSGGPQILSNVKLTSAISTTSSATMATATQQQFLQHQLKNVSTGIRTSVKICQSPNGKVFIQPANVDAATKAKLQSGLQHKLLSSALIGSAGVGGGTCGVGATSSTPQRIAIQKVQIIPAPLSSSGSFTGTLQTFHQQHQQQQKSTTLTLGNKSNMNMIFMPATSARSTAGTITLTAKGNSAAVGSVGNVIASKVQSPQIVDAIKPNVVVIGATTTMPTMQATHQQQATTLKSTTSSISNICSSASSSSSAIQFDSNQMITEDTPVDILNMPIIVDNSESGIADSVIASDVVGKNIIGDTVTVLSSALIDAQSQQQEHPAHSTVILDATDWEMELDQATADAAATKARSEYQRSDSGDVVGSVGGQKKSFGEQQQQNLSTDNSIAPIIIDDSFEDVIVEEQEEEQEVMAGDTTEEDVEENSAEECELSNAPNDDIIMLSDAKAKVVDLKTIHPHNEDDEQIEVVDEEQQKPNKKTETGNIQSHVQMHATECEMNADFDESMVTEIDENTAIEYIEEDQSDAMTVEIKGNTEINLPTEIVESNNANGKSMTKNALQNENLKVKTNYDNLNCHVNEEVNTAAKNILSFETSAAAKLTISVDDNISLHEEH